MADLIFPDAAAAAARPGVAPHHATYQVDPTQSEVRFCAKSFGLITVRGRIPVVNGVIRVSGDRVRATAEAASGQIDTGLPARDRHLRTSHYLHTEAHPHIRYSVQNATLDAEEITGSLTVCNVTASVTITIDRLELTDGVLHIQARTALDRTPYPMLPPITGVSRVINIELSITARADALDRPTNTDQL
jgi:polyisoprenoid-binding protein YceI